MLNLSIVIPVYNAERYILETIKSCLAHTKTNDEIIIVDDCSTDRSYAICEEVARGDVRVKLFRLAENKGVSAARNKGIDVAQGKWIMFLDSDDLICEDIHEIMIETAESIDANVIGAKHYVFFNDYCEEVGNNDGSVACRCNNKEECLCAARNLFYPYDCISKGKIYENDEYVWGKLFKTDFLRDNAIFFLESLKMEEDKAFMSKVFLHLNSYVVINKCVVKYRQRKTSLTHGRQTEQYLKRIEVCYNEDYLNFLLDNNLVTVNEIENVQIKAICTNLFLTEFSASNLKTFLSDSKIKNVIKNDNLRKWLIDSAQKKASRLYYKTLLALMDMHAWVALSLYLHVAGKVLHAETVCKDKDKYLW